MQSRQLPGGNYSETKQKAIEDARSAQAIVLRECADASRDPPPYELQELIGKGSFGRVYKASRASLGQTVAVKIISLEDRDACDSGGADTLADIIKEVNTLKSLTSSGARNINVVLDTIVVGPSVWMVTEHCAGGSVASLMRPTSGLPEKWIIPILREVAEALYWVHRHGIIHRDIKCANVLIAEAGGVQLCDFGVAGIMETKFDKRHTVTGTLHWMAPELFDSSVAYGSEVDIWAFGSMAYEIASGLPPNATQRINIHQFGSHLKQYSPRLQGDFSDALKELVAFCLVDDPTRRPPIEDVQKHRYIFETEAEYPTASLSRLVADYKLWESQGGSRQSLFSAGGAQGPSRVPAACRLSGWEFNGFEEADWGDSDQLTLTSPGRLRAPLSPSGPPPPPPPSSGIQDSSLEDTPTQARRRRPPPNCPEIKVPLEKVFDPYTVSKYEDNSRRFYGGKTILSPVCENMMAEEPSGECLIDLDAAQRPASIFIDMDTIKPALRPLSTDFSDYIESTRGRTQDWTFPAAAAAALTPTTPSIDSFRIKDDDIFRIQDDLPSIASPPAPSPSFLYADSPVPSLSHPPNNRDSSASLIDLNACLFDDDYDNGNSNNSNNNSSSTRSNVKNLSINLASPPRYHYPQYVSPLLSSASLAFDLDAAPCPSPSYYYADADLDPPVPPLSRQLSYPDPLCTSAPATPGERSDFQWAPAPGLGLLAVDDLFSALPPLPKNPSLHVMHGLSSQDDLRDELRFMLCSLKEHLEYASDCIYEMSAPSE
ncbi:Serine/threonine-protein kinase nak1 [Escovopsis weberi]|uniref:non-specific serine/threonine protein kinase n=1 Tax=Escovopsis weberi TaxID=150374 RepID=A0A0M9VTC7_ESCWE|nr:Serine/threonine-protein kinase nak1 [Escovopsis weberi]